MFTVNEIEELSAGEKQVVLANEKSTRGNRDRHWLMDPLLRPLLYFEFNHTLTSI